MRRKPTHVYLIRRSDGCHKIGVSVDPLSRLRPTAGPDSGASVVHWFPSANAYRVENALHVRFISCRVHGEWFRLTPEDVALIEAVRRADSPADLPSALQPPWGARFSRRGSEVPVGVLLPHDLIARLKDTAAGLAITMPNLLRLALSENLPAYERRADELKASSRRGRQDG